MRANISPLVLVLYSTVFRDEVTTVLQDRAYIEQMKADILRRAEAMSDSEEEEEVSGRCGHERLDCQGEA